DLLPHDGADEAGCPGRPRHAPRADQPGRGDRPGSGGQRVIRDPRPGDQWRRGPYGGPLPLVRREMTVIIRHGRVIDPGRINGPADVLIQDGKIAQVATELVVPPGATVMDASGKWGLPGFVDLQVHRSEPWAEEQGTGADGTAG